MICATFLCKGCGQAVTNLHTCHKPKLTVHELGAMLHASFEEDSWGDLDPIEFADPRKSEDDESEYTGLYEVLERVVEKINKKFGA